MSDLRNTFTRLIRNHIDQSEGDLDYAKFTARGLTSTLLDAVAAAMTGEVAIEAAAKGAWNHNTTEWTWEKAKADGSGFLAERMRTNIEAARPAIDAALKAAGVGTGRCAAGDALPERRGK